MFRNKEIRYTFLCFFVTAAVMAAAGFRTGPGAGILIVIFAVISGALFFVSTWARYRRIAKISEQIDLVLHEDDYLYISEEEEGELSILQSEITKMTLRIREQNRALKKEKENLADSLADIAHQLRTPLTSVNLILSLLEKNPDEKEQRTLFQEAEELLMKTDWLITSLLKLSRLDAGVVAFRSQEVNLRRLADAALFPLQIPLELHNIALCMDVPEEIVITGDFDWLAEALRNVFKNCMESAGDNGRIEITCTDTVLFTELLIHDSGAGFEKEDLSHLFDRFYRGKNSAAAGYGIGLALCRTILTRQGGTIRAKNHPKGGAVFTIRFEK